MLRPARFSRRSAAAAHARGRTPPSLPPLFTVRADDGFPIPVRRCLPEQKPHAVIVAVHGFRNHSGSFQRPASAWAEDDVATYAFDLRGFGAAGCGAPWPGGRRLYDDLRYVAAHARRKHRRVPLFVLGESMGAALLLAFASEANYPDVAGTILVSPAVLGWQKLPSVTEPGLRALAGKMPGLTAHARSPRGLATDNKAVLAAMDEDPLVQKRVRLDVLAGLIDLMNRALDNAEAIPQPALALVGARDRIIPGWVRRDFVRRLGDRAVVRRYARG